MRLALKHQIIMAPAVVLCLMTLLLCFLQFTYWDLSVKRQQAKELKAAFISLAEADMATKRMLGVITFLAQAETPDPRALEQLSDLHTHLNRAVERLNETQLVGGPSMSLLQQGVVELNPEHGMELEHFEQTLKILQPHIMQELNALDRQREDLSALHRQDIDTLVAETTFVTILVLGAAILLGILLSLAFARRILRRIKTLSDSAERITAGDFSPPPAPAQVRDELDGLAVSINKMTDQLIRVVAAEKLLEGAEDERRRIAMDLHDQTLADLSGVCRKLERLRGASPCSEEAVEIGQDLQKAMANLRVVMDNLHPQTLDILGLPAAIESFLDKHCAFGTPTFHFLADNGVAVLALPRLTQVTLYRITVEAINNVIRHARASQLEVGMGLRGGQLVIAVEDNGCGFDHALQLPTATGGRGLHNIRERARAIGAEVSWRNSRFSSGTRFELVLPTPQGA